MQIVHVQHPYIPDLGYQENHVPYRQQRIGHDVTIISTTSVPMKDETTRKYRAFEPGQYEYRGVPTFRLNDWLWEDSGKVIIRGLANKLSDLDPDVIHLHGLLDIKTFQTVRYASKSGTPLFIDVHLDNGNIELASTFKRTAVWTFRQTVVNWLIRYTNLFMPVNPFAKRFLISQLGIAESRIELLPLGIDDVFREDPKAREKTREELEIPSDGFVIADSGKFNPTKDTHELVRAFGIVNASHPDTHLLLIGDGDDEYVNAALSLAKELGVRENLHLTGWVDYEEVPRYYNAADLGVMPGKLSSGKDMLGVGLPLIVAESSATEYLISNDNGSMYQRGDVAALAETIESYILDDERYRTARSNAVELVEDKLSWDAVAKLSIDLYERYQ